MEEEREEQKLKNPSELKDSENLRERFVRIFSDVDKNNPINIDIDKEAWPIFLKVVEDYSHAEIMNAPDTEIVKKCISVKEIFFEQKNIITDGNGNPNIAANLKANPNFIEQNPEVREVLDHMHVDRFSKDSLYQMTEKGIYAIFLGENGESVDEERINSFFNAFESVIGESEWQDTTYISDHEIAFKGIIFSEDDVEKLNIDEKGNIIGVILKNGTIFTEEEVKEPDGTTTYLNDIKSVMIKNGSTCSFYNDGNFVTKNGLVVVNNKEFEELRNERMAVFNSLGGEGVLKKGNFTDEQYNNYISALENEQIFNQIDAFSMDDFGYKFKLYANKDAEFRYISFHAEMLDLMSCTDKELKLQNGMVATLDGITLKDGTEISFRNLKKFMKENNIDENLSLGENGITLEDGIEIPFEQISSFVEKQSKKIKDEEAKEFVENSAEELDASAISDFQRKSSEDRAKQNRVVSDVELKNSRTERIETSGIIPEKGRAGVTVNSKKIAESNVDVTRTRKSEIEQQITARDKTQEEGAIGQDIKIDDREETDYKKKSILSRMVDMASRAINSLRGENDDIHNKTDNPKALMEYREKRNFWSGIISRLGFSETETYKKLSEEVTEEVSKDENSKNTNRFFRFMNAITGKSKEEKTAVEEDKNKIEQNAFDKYNATVNEEKAIADAKVAQEKMYAQKGNNEQEEVK